MRCMEALDALLSADLSDINSSPIELRVHLKECRRCQIVAVTLQSRTAALAGVARDVPLVAAPKAARTIPRTPRAAVLALAALAVVVLWPFTRTTRDAGTAPSVTAKLNGTSVSVDSSSQLTDRDANTSGRVAVAVHNHAEPQRSRRLADSSATTVASGDVRRQNLGEPIAAPSRIEAVPLLAVEVVLGDTSDVRATVGPDSTRRTPVLLPQSNPNITVYWVFDTR